MQDDATLIAASRRDPAAFRGVFDRHVDAVFGFLARRVGRQAAEDLAAETFTAAFAQRRRYDTRYADARPWLLGIATNLVRRDLRAGERRGRALERVAATVPIASPDEPSGLSSDAIAALRALDVRQREALLLHVWGQLSYDEVARALGVPRATVGTRIHRARANLRTALAASNPAARIEEDSAWTT